MQFVNVKDFKTHATHYLSLNEEVVITKYGKPIARLVPETEDSIAAILEAAGQILANAGITREDALSVIKKVRKKKSRS